MNNTREYLKPYFIDVNKYFLLELLARAYPYRTDSCRAIIKQILSGKLSPLTIRNQKLRQDIAKDLELASFNYSVPLAKDTLKALVNGTKYQIIVYLGLMLRFIPYKGIKIRFSNLTNAFHFYNSQITYAIRQLMKKQLLAKSGYTYLPVINENLMEKKKEEKPKPKLNPKLIIITFPANVNYLTWPPLCPTKIIDHFKEEHANLN